MSQHTLFKCLNTYRPKNGVLLHDIVHCDCLKCSVNNNLGPFPLERVSIVTIETEVRVLKPLDQTLASCCVL